MIRLLLQFILKLAKVLMCFSLLLAGTYIGTVVTHNYCTGDTPESHVGVVAYLSGACGV
jgi:hypothetical protein